ncbi:MAG: hypothetical protein ACK42D_01235 [Candidatus Paceibacteria bacterium]
MSGIKDQTQIDAMRQRLYERGAPLPEKSQRHDLSKSVSTAKPKWDVETEHFADEENDDPRPQALHDETVAVHPLPDIPASGPGRTYAYRSIILLAALAFFFVTLLGTSLYLLLGNNQISNKNIGITIAGPLTAGGGEVLPLQLTVSNQNNVPIESAVLIVNFPAGTKSADGQNRDIFEERMQLERIAAGESLTVPIRAVVYGEENQEKTVGATLEYRLVDSNGTFFKEAEPLIFKIISSPLVLRIESVEKVSSGQEVEVKMVLQSNSSNSLKNILVSANYPSNFDFTSSDPAPTYRQSEWIIAELKPEQSQTITLRGQVRGVQNEEFQMQFSAGTPRQDNQFIISSVLANATADFLIEHPFVNVGLVVNNVRSEIITAQTGQQTTVAVEVQNTLSETLFDMAVEVGVSGNVLSREQIIVDNGFYDSAKDVVRFEVAGDRTLSEVFPGQTRRFSFTIIPSAQQQTPAFAITANAYARRVSENRVTEALIGTAKSEVKYTSSLTLNRILNHRNDDTGPVPPVAEQQTTYTLTMEASAGGNDVTGAVVTTSLPQYVSWTDKSSGEGTIVFNPVSKEITWTIGDIRAGDTVTRTFQISLTPSQNQIGQTPALVGVQRFRATDKFTGAVVRAESSSVSAELSTSSGFGRDSGKVLRAVVESE